MNAPERPDPERLLALATAEERRHRGGRLQIFFGATAGVGKTYAMLDAAREFRARGGDVVVGWIETHGRAETAALLGGLERLPVRTTLHRGVQLAEFDLDAALARKPAVLLLDELAHTNAPGSRHAKRWQDVEELLAAGLDVWTTLNVQHLESAADLVERITGVVVRETVPDSLFDRADPVRLIDLAPDRLLERLAEGKVYVPEQAQRAREHFFRPGNLSALRELALRKTADRVDGQMMLDRQGEGISAPWPIAERLLVGVSSGPQAQRVVRAGRRLAERLRADWEVVYVETPRERSKGETEREEVWKTLRLAERLGAETRVLAGLSAEEELVRQARRINASKLVIGKPANPRWRDRWIGTFQERLLRTSGGIDLYVLAGDDEQNDETPRLPAPPRLQASPRSRLLERGYLFAGAAVLSATAVAAFLFPDLAEANRIMLYLLAVVAIASTQGRGPAILASVASVALFDFFFVSPRLTFAVHDTEYLVTFGIMLATALTISTLTARLKTQAELFREREARTRALYDLAHDLAAAANLDAILAAAATRLHEMFLSQVVLLLPEEQDSTSALPQTARLIERASETITYRMNEREHAVARWVFDHGQPAGKTTDTLPNSLGLYVPLRTARGTLGVLGLHPADREYLTRPDNRGLLAACAGQIALAVELRRSLAT